MQFTGGVIRGLQAWSIGLLKESFFTLLLDILAPTVLLDSVNWSQGNLTNQEASWRLVTTRAFLAVALMNFIIENKCISIGVYYQPTFLYESLWSFVGVLILLYLRN